MRPGSGLASAARSSDVSRYVIRPFGRRFVRPRTAGRRHQIAVQLLDDLLPDLGVLADVGDVDVVERQPAGFRLFVVAGDAVAVHNRAMRMPRLLLRADVDRCDQNDRCAAGKKALQNARMYLCCNRIQPPQGRQ